MFQHELLHVPKSPPVHGATCGPKNLYMADYFYNMVPLTSSFYRLHFRSPILDLRNQPFLDLSLHMVLLRINDKQTCKFGRPWFVSCLVSRLARFALSRRYNWGRLLPYLELPPWNKRNQARWLFGWIRCLVPRFAGRREADHKRWKTQPLRFALYDPSKQFRLRWLQPTCQSLRIPNCLALAEAPDLSAVLNDNVCRVQCAFLLQSLPALNAGVLAEGSAIESVGDADGADAGESLQPLR